MSKLVVTIQKDSNTQRIETEGCLLVYLEGGVFKFSGQLEMSALTPLLTKVLLERLK